MEVRSFVPSSSRLRLVLLAACLSPIVPSHAAPPTAGRPQMPLWNAAQIEGLCDSSIVRFRKVQATMEAMKGSSGIFDEWNRLATAVGDVSDPLGLVANTSTDKATRDAADACIVKFTPFQTDLFQSEALYRRVSAAKPVDAIQAQYRQDLIDSFEDAGVTLSTDKRARAKAIVQKIQDLSQQFEKNIRDDTTTVVVTPAEMAGMSDAFIASQKKDDRGNYVLTLAYPSFFPFMTAADNAEARKRMWIAKMNEGTVANIDVMDRIVPLRLELAQLYGYPDYASYVLKRRMAGDPATVYAFLDSVQNVAGDLEKKDLAELRQWKAEAAKLPIEQTPFERWDLLYYQEKLKKARYNVDQEGLRKYFRTDASLAYTMKVAETLYGIRFVPSDAPVWHPDVKAFDVFERSAGGGSGAFIGSVYIDLFPREGKFRHAAVFPIRAQSTLARQSAAPGYRTPLAALVTNFDRNGLTHGELQTMMHEFGHLMHETLSKTRYADEAGTRVKRDFVEAPSQMFEEWARREDSLKLLAAVCSDCPQLTHEQIDQIESARRFGRGLQYARQVVYARFDMSLTTPKPDETLAAWQTIERATPLGTYPGTMFPASFGHLIGYAAGYYGYLWSQVLAIDMLSGFHGKLMNPEDGRRYRTLILSQGGQEPPEKLVENFLGRKPNSDAFFKEITGQR